MVRQLGLIQNENEKTKTKRRREDGIANSICRPQIDYSLNMGRLEAFWQVGLGFANHIFEPVEMGDAHLSDQLLAEVAVGCGVVVGYERDTDGDMVCTFELDKAAEVVHHQGIVAAGVGVVDGGVGVFDVYDKIVGNGGYRLHMLGRHVERGFDGQFPVLATKLAERFDEVDSQQRLASAKAHAASGGDEIEVVDAHFLVELLGRIGRETFLIVKALRIEAVFAAQGASVEGGQGGYSFAVDADAVARYADKWSLHDAVG